MSCLYRMHQGKRGQVNKKKMKKKRKGALGKPSTPPEDNPYLRQKALTFDIISGSEGKPLGEFRVAAIKQSKEMRQAETVEPHLLPTPGISNWVQLGPVVIPNGQPSPSSTGSRVLVTGRVTSIVIDPTHNRTIYIGTAQGGIWKTEDGGSTWSTRTDDQISLAIGAMAMDPHNTSILYAGTGEGNLGFDSYYGNGVLKTTDFGITWSLLASSTFSMSSFCRIVVNPSTSTTIFAALISSGNLDFSGTPPGATGIYRSTDSGVTWTKMTNGLPTNSVGATDIVINPGDTDIVYAAFWADGIYKTTNANAATPIWTKLTTGLPTVATPPSFTRIALGISSSSPLTLYALMAGDSPLYIVNQLYRTIDGGASWNPIPLHPPFGDIGLQGFYNLNVAVDPITSDIVYLQAISVWKATRNPFTGEWTTTNIGDNIHVDNHAFAFDPTDHKIIYTGNDGGIYRSDDGGATWDDSINKGFCITQFEFMDQHPTSDAFVLAGTQDNGTDAFCNDPVFKHMDDGDGGFTAIDSVSPNIVYHDFTRTFSRRSTLGGRLGSWADINSGLDCDDSLFYSPFALDQTNPNNIAFGCNKIAIDPMGGTSGWPIDVILPGLLAGELVSAVNYINSNLIYAGTGGGKVFRLTRSGTAWTATPLHAPPLPSRYIWDVSPLPNQSVIVVVMSGFGTPHVWRGTVSEAGSTAWSDISGTGTGRLPDIPVNALVIEPSSSNTMYIGTDIGVFRTIDGGTTWENFSQGLPNCAVYDMRLHNPTRLLRVATHGRGMWERKLDVASMPDVDIFVRDNLMDTARFTPSSSGIAAAFEDPTEGVSLGQSLDWFRCADIKIDALGGTPLDYQIPNVKDVDYVVFESKLKHHSPQPGSINRVYLQVHNRGIHYPAGDVFVKVLYGPASAGLPPLPADFWTKFPDDSSNTTYWKPIGAARMIYSDYLSPSIPGVLEWDWLAPPDADEHSCLLVVIDPVGTEDAIPSANKVFNIATLVRNEKHVGLKNLHVVQGLVGTMYWTKFQFFGDPEMHYTIRISPLTVKKWSMGLIFQKSENTEIGVEGVTVKKPTREMLLALKKKIGEKIEQYDTSKMYMVDDSTKGGTLANMKLSENGLQSMLLFVPPRRDTVLDGTVSITQFHDDQGVVGGSTFILRTIKQYNKHKQK